MEKSAIIWRKVIGQNRLTRVQLVITQIVAMGKSRQTEGLRRGGVVLPVDQAARGFAGLQGPQSLPQPHHRHRAD